MTERTFTRNDGTWAKLILGDCRDVLPTLAGGVDCLVTDPPYGIGFHYEAGYDDSDGMNYVRLIESLKGFPLALLQYPEEMMRLICPILGPPDECLVWCYNSNTARQSRLWGFWNIAIDFSRVKQPAKNIGDPRVRNEVASYDWTDDYQQVKNVSAEKTEHPCQIPEGLAARVIKLTGAKTILDPFLGSGTMCVAAMRLGVNSIGIEISPKYYEVACKRVEAEARQSVMEWGE